MIPFAPFLPDLPAFETAAAREALNVIPAAVGYRPFATFANVAAAITARAQGAVSVRDPSDASIFNFCGDATNLYKMDSDGLGWTDVSRLAGGDYATATDGFWSFAQYGDYIIATNGNDAPQVWQLGVSSNWAALGGSPPTARFAGVIRGFAILAGVNTARNQIAWSAIDNHADWTPSATTLSDTQDFYEGGIIMGFAGGEFGIVFQERAIQRMSFEGPPTAFRFDKIANFLGCRAEGSVAQYENLVFFLSDDGFYMIRGGAEIVPIGSEKVDRYFETNLDATYLYRITSAIDPINKLYVIGYPSTSASSGTPDSLLMYHWPTGQWSRASQDHEIIYPAATQSTYTIDDMDTVSSTIDALPYPVDSRFWAGAGRLLLAGFDTSHRQGFFTGAAKAATIETGDAQLAPGRKSLLRGMRPMVEGSDATPAITIGKRNRLQDSVSYGSAVDAQTNGYCPLRVNARYHRARLTIPAASSWTFARGVDDVRFTAMGQR